MGISAIIVAGGKSSRMGQDKAMMVYHQQTMIEHMAEELKKIADEVIVASNDKAKYRLPGIVEVPDIYPNTGPLGGIHAGLMAIKNDYAMVVSCDMPRFSWKIAKYLIDRKSGYDVVAPEISGRWEPLCAVYSRACLPVIEKRLQSGSKKVSGFYEEVKVLKIRENELNTIGDIRDMFLNLNTPQDYRQLIEREGK